GAVTAGSLREKKKETLPAGHSLTVQEAEEGVGCFLEIRCDTVLDHMDQLLPQKGEYIPVNGVILERVRVNFEQGETAFELLQRVCNETGIPLEYSFTPLYNSYYIEGINHLYEFDCGSRSGWMYQVNEEFPAYGASSYIIQPEDVITWHYTCQGLGEDVGAKILEE
ncbi:MAG: DUF4430 domain-containing protein, partial [Lachnospiraceae bacterium]|nr:DUF4430 domain-containing protein [Lachnospiraceae bacterium]